MSFDSRYLLFAFLFSVSLLGCDATAPPAVDTSGNQEIPQAPEGSGVVHVASGDPKMEAAMLKGRSTLPFFEQSWKSKGHDLYSVKFSLPTSDGDREHIWFSPTKIEGDSFTGTCANDPIGIPDLKLGDIRTVDRSEVSDWMMLIGQKCWGGYTIRVLDERDPDAAPPLKFIDHEE